MGNALEGIQPHKLGADELFGSAVKIQIVEVAALDCSVTPGALIIALIGCTLADGDEVECCLTAALAVALPSECWCFSS